MKFLDLNFTSPVVGCGTKLHLMILMMIYHYVENFSLSFLKSPFSPRVVVPVMVSSMAQKEVVSWIRTREKIYFVKSIDGHFQNILF